ncbi:chondroitin AC/alginate lyase [Mycena rosella]|uniref:Chondroitin AC/alginate lyase n=1 Tax=Mycena rosella TaxID=1033263 RepID=A0AAD7GVB7_MYCRO|nr:chondroitin AC/alginate lyase [Mycena rosella]
MRASSLFSCILYIYRFYALSAIATAARIPRSFASNISSTPTPTQANLTTSTTATTGPVSTNTTSSAKFAASSSVSAQPQPTSTPIDPATAQDIATFHERRLSNIVGSLTAASSISSWLSTLQANGQWPDVDYTAGCDGQRANWPAEVHWKRISTMAGAWNGGLAGADQHVKDSALRNSLSIAMGYWFSNDFTNGACLASGGGADCPCDTLGLWNTNWFPNVIGTPELVSMTCLLLNDSLVQTELDHCTFMTSRAYGTDVFLDGTNLPASSFAQQSARSILVARLRGLHLLGSYQYLFAPHTTVDIFSAGIVHESPNASFAYTIYPGTNLNTFIAKSSQSQVHVIQNDAVVSAALEESGSTSGDLYSLTNGTAAFMFDWESGIVTVSDPTQTLSAVSVTLRAESGTLSGLEV